jgi:hypothetical protein
VLAADANSTSGRARFLITTARVLLPTGQARPRPRREAENVSADPPARKRIPKISSGTDWPPVNGRFPVLPGVKTVVEVTIGTVDPCPCSVVLVDPTIVVPERSKLVVVSGAVVVVVSPGNVVVAGGSVVTVGFGLVVVLVVVLVDVVVVAAVVVVVVSPGYVVVTGGVLVEVVAGTVVLVDVEGPVVVVVGSFAGPQNCTFEMSGRFFSSSPTFGRPAFENSPSYCGGAIVVSTASGPPFTITAETARVECHVPPEADVSERVTTCSFPAGFSKSYPWS